MCYEIGVTRTNSKGQKTQEKRKDEIGLWPQNCWFMIRDGLEKRVHCLMNYKLARYIIITITNTDTNKHRITL